MEKDDELKGSGNSYDFGARIYDPRTGRFLSIDPLFNIPQNISLSTYQFANNTPIMAIDKDGEFWHVVVGAVVGAVAKGISLAVQGEDFSKGSTWAKIGAGAVTGATIATLPFSIFGIAGAGGIGFVSDITDQAIDKIADGEDVLDMNSYNYKSAGISSGITAVTFGIGASWGKNLRSTSIAKNWTGSLNRTDLMKLIYKNPSLAGSLTNSTAEVCSSIVTSIAKQLRNTDSKFSNAGIGTIHPDDANEDGSVREGGIIKMIAPLKEFQVIENKNEEK